MSLAVKRGRSAGITRTSTRSMDLRNHGCPAQRRVEVWRAIFLYSPRPKLARQCQGRGVPANDKHLLDFFKSEQCLESALKQSPI